MKRFEFQFAALLRLRRNECDRRQSALAELVGQDRAAAQKRGDCESERRRQMDELRALGTAGEIDIEPAASRHAFVAQLTATLEDIDRDRLRLARQIEASRRDLLNADQAVRALEKLAERRAIAFVAEFLRQESRDHEESWNAAVAR